MNGAGWVWLNSNPLLAAALAVAALVSIVSGFLSARKLSAGRRTLLFILRLAGLAVILIAILRPARLMDITRALKPPLAVLLDTSRSMTQGQAPVGTAALDWLTSRSGRMEKLSSLYRIEYLGVGVPPSSFETPLKPDPAVFRSDETPLRRSLEEIARLKPGLSGLVLLSDGQDTERPDDPPLGLPYPVHVLMASKSQAKDLWIERIETPPVAFIRTPLSVRVHVGSVGFPADKATLTLFEEGRALQTASLHVPPGGASMELTFTPIRIGRKTYSVEVSPWPGETLRENNIGRFSLRVIRDKTRVLLVAGTPTWDSKFLRKRLREDPGIDLITFMILRTPQDSNIVPQEEMSLIPFPTHELFSTELPSFDVVIFQNFDFAPYVPRQYLDNIVKFVKDSGGGFAMIGGDRSFALGGYQGTPIEEILPVDFSGSNRGKQYLSKAFRPRLTPAGETHPLTVWKPGRTENNLFWNRLPKLTGMNWILKPKPGALVLAENPEERNEHGPMPVIAAAEAGAGRVLGVAADDLWRWGLPFAGAGGEASAYKDFWSRALRWLAHDPDMELVRLALPASGLRAGQKTNFHVRVLTRGYEPATGAALSGRLAREEGRSETRLVWSESAPGEYSSQPVTLAQEGTWKISVEASAGQILLGRDELTFPVGPSSPELDRIGLNKSYLEKLASSSGGTVSDMDDDRVFSELESRGKTEVEIVGRRIEEVWPVWPLMLLGLAALCVDWGLRRFWT